MDTTLNLYRNNLVQGRNNLEKYYDSLENIVTRDVSAEYVNLRVEYTDDAPTPATHIITLKMNYQNLQTSGNIKREDGGVVVVSDTTYNGFTSEIKMSFSALFDAITYFATHAVGTFHDTETRKHFITLLFFLSEAVRNQITRETALHVMTDNQTDLWRKRAKFSLQRVILSNRSTILDDMRCRYWFLPLSAIKDYAAKGENGTQIRVSDILKEMSYI